MSEESKESKREGNSPRANVYRTKDEVLDFAFSDISEFGKTHKLDGPGGVYSLMGEVRVFLQKLDETPDDAELAESAIRVIRSIKDKLNELGFSYTPKSAAQEA